MEWEEEDEIPSDVFVGISPRFLIKLNFVPSGRMYLCSRLFSVAKLPHLFSFQLPLTTKQQGGGGGVEKGGGVGKEGGR